MARSILITGCSSGIGHDCAHYLRQKGWRVFASCRKADDCARLRDQGFEAPRIDYEDEGSVASGLAEVLETSGGTLDALFNNGAYAIPGAVEDLPRAALRQNLEANLLGYHDLSCRVIPVMRAQGHGRILNCSSVLGFAALRWRGSYNTTKFALEGLTDTLRLELRGTNIHPILIQPGPIGTEIRRNSVPHFERWIDCENSARRSLYVNALRPRLYAERKGPDPFELTPRAVSIKVHTALTARRPAARYKITTPTYALAMMRRLLPRAAMDNLLARL
ncbi:MAG: SDR family NAD(P)-dependent oxidoreductase [Pseudomonadota bacterium]